VPKLRAKRFRRDVVGSLSVKSSNRSSRSTAVLRSGLPLLSDGLTDLNGLNVLNQRGRSSISHCANKLVGGTVEFGLNSAAAQSATDVEVPNIAQRFGSRGAECCLDNRKVSTIFNETNAPARPTMKMLVDDISESPSEIQFFESIQDLNETFAHGQAGDFRFPPEVEVDLACYRSGRELFFHGSLRGQVDSRCARCLKDFSMPVEHNFDFVLSPVPLATSAATEELKREDLGLSYYSGDEVNLAPLIREQVMLALPTRPLCTEDCRGLCGGCGADLNHESCRCSRGADDPRMAFFRTLRIER
jgi:uncharacterized protein